MLSTASLISELCRACSKISAPASVSRRFRVERSIKRTPSCFSRSATRRLTVEIGIFRRRAAEEKLLASTTFAKIINEFRSVIARPIQSHRSRTGRIIRVIRLKCYGAAATCPNSRTTASPARELRHLTQIINELRSLELIPFLKI